MNIVILGTGIIGTSTAYHLSLSQAPSSVHLVEPSTALFASASGYAGGFLAKNWFPPSAAALGNLSFEEHRRLAEEHNGRKLWGYSTTTGARYIPEKGGTVGKHGADWLMDGVSRAEAAATADRGGGFVDCVGNNEPMWLRRGIGDKVEIISGEGSAAQIDPLRLSQYLLSSCLKQGVQLHHPAKAILVSKDMRGELSNVRIVSMDSSRQIDIPCTHLIITAGAWSPEVFRTLFPDAEIELPISTLAGHSLVVRSPRWTAEHENRGCHAIFTTDEAGYSPEIFSRIGGEIYVAGLNSSSISLPALATEAKIDKDAIKQLQMTSKRLLGTPGVVGDLEIIREGLCFRPVTKKGVPILARIPDNVLGRDIRTKGGADGGVYLAAGHGPWGISMSLGTGKVMAEMVQGLPPSVDVEGLGL